MNLRIRCSFHLKPSDQGLHFPRLADEDPAYACMPCFPSRRRAVWKTEGIKLVVAVHARTPGQLIEDRSVTVQTASHLEWFTARPAGGVGAGSPMSNASGAGP